MQHRETEFNFSAFLRLSAQQTVFKGYKKQILQNRSPLRPVLVGIFLSLPKTIFFLVNISAVMMPGHKMRPETGNKKWSRTSRLQKKKRRRRPIWAQKSDRRQTGTSWFHVKLTEVILNKHLSLLEFHPTAEDMIRPSTHKHTNTLQF